MEKNAAIRHRTGNFVKMTVEICLQPCYNTLESSKNQEEVRFGNEKKNRYSDQRRRLPRLERGNPRRDPRGV